MARVMIVEDEMVVAADIMQTVSAMGHVVAASATTGAEAVARALAVRPDLILMDIRLRGEMDGIQAGAAIRETIDVPMIFLTAFADAETVDRALSIEPFGYVMKPFTERDLRTAIEIAIHKHGLERELRNRERWVSTTLRSIGDAVVATNATGNITFLNRMAEALTGWTHELAVGKTLGEVLQLVAGSTGAPSRFPVEEACESRQIQTIDPDSMLLSRSGTQIPVDDSVAPIIGDAGDLMGAVIVFRDISERKKMETKLAISERMVALGTMTAGLAHEMNNPLAFVTGNAELAWQELATLEEAIGQLESSERLAEVRASIGALREMLTDLRDGTERAARIVRDLRLFSRSDDRTMAVVDLREIAETAVRMVGNEVRHRAAFTKQLDAAPKVRGSATQLSQVISNLLVNAAQSIPSGASSDDHRIRLVLGTADDGRALIEVHDTGVGIPPELMVRIFDPFFTTKPIGVGTGLGLPICHGIVATHQGEITASSTPGEGTLFRIVLPPASGREQTTPVPAEKRPVVPVGPRAKILIVDDDKSIADMLARHLREHTVTVAYEAAAVLERVVAGGETFDLVLCDLMMPGMTGMDLAAAIERARPDQARRLLFMTGGAFTEKARAFLSGREGRWIEKPFALDELNTFMTRALASLVSN
jgi:two-component system, cell cycle sensor histidine kinase and response regulator CckA